MRIAPFLAAALTAGIAAAQSGSFVTSGAGCPRGWTPLRASDDVVLGPLALGFSFSYAGGLGSTASIEVSSNGHVYLEPGTIVDERVYFDLAQFASETPSIAVFGNDLDPPELGGDVYFATDGVSRAVVTWLGVPEWSAPQSTAPMDIQIQLASDGSFVTCYRSSYQTVATTIVGYSPGNGATDPGPVDLSAGAAAGVLATDMVYESFDGTARVWDLDATCLTWTPDPASGSYDVAVGGAFVARDPSAPLELFASSGPNIGERFAVGVTDLPPDAAAAALNFGSIAVSVPLDVVGAIGCSIYADGVWLSVPMPITLPDASFAFALPYDVQSIGLVAYAQVAAISPASNSLGVVLSNLGTMTVGDRPTLRAVAEDAGDTSCQGHPGAGGYFRLEYATTGALDIVGLRCDAAGTPWRFDTDGNCGAFYFDDGNGVGPSCQNAFFGSDVTTGLVYGLPGQPASSVFCGDPQGTTGWIGSNPGAPSEFATLDFAFDDFQPGETFGFDCDTDFPVPDTGAGHAGVVVTVTFADMSTVSGVLAATADPSLAEVVLIP